ncbi:MAG TPA: CaiB/BaiF CoA-transferase family protein [Actinomycetota bacterium]|nr:CaiB/BaiF CoA-transferase family protein [Actinomycetota bacterium]
MTGMGPLQGIRVLDLSRLAPGPYGGMLLADMGADVVRVDRAPLGGELMPRYGDVVGRGKRSVALNLKHPAGVEAALRLVERADVLLEGFRPGVMERLGLGPDDVAARNPRCVYARLTGWGQDGPLAERAGHDINYIAISGVLSAIGRAGEPPVPPVNLLGDFAGGGLLCAFGIVCALVERERSGRGQVVDAAMLDGATNLFSFFSAAVHAGMWGPRGTNMLDTGVHFYDVYECADGGYVSVGAIEPQFYAQLLDGLGLAPEDLPHTQHDPAGQDELRRIFAERFRTRTRDEWAAVFEERDACVYPVLEPREAPGHRHNAAREVFVTGPFDVVQPAPAPRLDRTPGAIAGPAPEPGEHTRDVLGEAGYTGDELDDLRAQGAIAWP